MTALRAAPPAKVNLALEVTGRRPDGYHELRSVLAPLALADTLTVRAAPRGSSEDELRQSGEPCGPVRDNLVLRAADLLRAWSGRALPPLRFELHKRIPAGAGLGGGSSDAAWTLRLAAAAWGLHPSARQLHALALELGSDVPFFLLDDWALVGGRGELLRPIPAPAGSVPGVVLVTPARRLVTRAVFDVFDALGREGVGPAQPDDGPGGPPAGGMEPRAGGARVPRAGPGRGRAPGGASASLAAGLERGLSTDELAALAPANDLWPAAVCLLPELRDLRTGLQRLLGRHVHLSGSGPTLFVLYPSLQAARRAGSRVRVSLRGGTLPCDPGSPPAVIATATRGGPA